MKVSIKNVKPKIKNVDKMVLKPNLGPKIKVPIINNGISIHKAYKLIFQGHTVFNTFERPYVPPGAKR